MENRCFRYYPSSRVIPVDFRFIYDLGKMSLRGTRKQGCSVLWETVSDIFPTNAATIAQLPSHKGGIKRHAGNNTRIVTTVNENFVFWHSLRLAWTACSLHDGVAQSLLRRCTSSYTLKISAAYGTAAVLATAVILRTSRHILSATVRRNSRRFSPACNEFNPDTTSFPYSVFNAETVHLATNSNLGSSSKKYPTNSAALLKILSATDGKLPKIRRVRPPYLNLTIPPSITLPIANLFELFHKANAAKNRENNISRAR